MHRCCRIVAWVVLFVAGNGSVPANDESGPELQLFSGERRLFVVNGYSTSRQWPSILQRKLDRYFDDRRIIEVRSVIKGGTPIAKWMDVQTGEPGDDWIRRLRPVLGDDERPVIVLAQQSLQWAYGERQAGIRSADDRKRIEAGADILRMYAEQLLEDGADMVFIAMHIYKTGMEPEIGNERLALSEYLTGEPDRVHAGPDVWKPTKELWPQAFAADQRHPNGVGAEVMAQKWFEALLEHEGLEVPEWSVEETRTVIEGAGR